MTWSGFLHLIFENHEFFFKGQRTNRGSRSQLRCHRATARKFRQRISCHKGCRFGRNKQRHRKARRANDETIHRTLRPANRLSGNGEVRSRLGSGEPYVQGFIRVLGEIFSRNRQSRRLSYSRTNHNAHRRICLCTRTLRKAERKKQNGVS